MSTRKRYIGQVMLPWESEDLPTDFFMDYQKDRFVFIAETEIPHSDGPRISSSAERLIDLLRLHRRKLESMKSESNGLSNLA